MSPLFYRWSSTAVRSYYTGEQRKAHRRLLLAVRAHVLANDTSTTTATMTATDDDDDNGDDDNKKARSTSSHHHPLDQFTREFAGQPVMYGSK